MAHLKRYGQHFNVNIEKMKNLKKIGLLAHPEVSLSRIVSPQKAVFKAFFFRKSLFWPISVQWCPPSVIHGWKAVDLSSQMVKMKNYFFASCRA
jgi:hypothetical protein